MPEATILTLNLRGNSSSSFYSLNHTVLKQHITKFSSNGKNRQNFRMSSADGCPRANLSKTLVFTRRVGEIYAFRAPAREKRAEHALLKALQRRTFWWENRFNYLILSSADGARKPFKSDRFHNEKRLNLRAFSSHGGIPLGTGLLKPFEDSRFYVSGILAFFEFRRGGPPSKPFENVRFHGEKR